MKLIKDIEIIDLAIYLKKENILVLADTHIGYEEALNKQGVLIPRFQFKEIIIRLARILAQLEKNCSGACEGHKVKLKAQSDMAPPLKKESKCNKKKLLKKIIINGDVKHEFGRISDQEWRHTLKLLDFLKKYTKEIILIKGNHDKILGPIAEKRNVKVKDHIKINSTLIIHGDKLPTNTQLKDIKTIIIGHEHPAIGLREDQRVETFKSFLKGKYKKLNLIVQPSFNLVTEGTDLTKEKLLSPFLKQDLSNFEAYLVSDKIYKFGKLKNIT